MFKLYANIFLKNIKFFLKLLEGRRQIGGKLEIKIRIREPLLHKEVKHLEHKWLIIDKFEVQSSKV